MWHTKEKFLGHILAYLKLVWVIWGMGALVGSVKALQVFVVVLVAGL